LECPACSSDRELWQAVKILLVDDDPHICELLAALLRQQGHEVLEAYDGEVAWQLVEERQISFVVSDWMMPNLSGVDLCRRIRAADFERYVYVILCTGKGAKSDLIEGMDAGADDFLVKPIGNEELCVRIRAGERVLRLQQKLADKNHDLAGMNQRLHCAHKLIEDDLKAAAWMQERLLPAPTLQAHGVRCEWRLQPSGYVAGDIFNFFVMDEKQVGFYLLDVSGHGVPAAMLSVALGMMLTPDATHGSPLKSYNRDTGLFEVLLPDHAIRELNRRFQLKDDRYFTMIYGLFDTHSSILRMAQAGHPSPILIRKDSRLQILGSGGMPIGVWPDIEFDCFDVSIKHGDRLLLYSDGVTECKSVHGETFGEDRVVDCLEQLSTRPLDELLGELMDVVRSWRGDSEFEDDLSLLAIEMP
jgi:sigma-B regulation protein RsbU (phosphoserine phosphatase)